MLTEEPNKELAIAFLVHDEVDSAHTALSTLNAFFKYTQLPINSKVDFYILINGRNEDIEDVIELIRCTHQNKVNFKIHQFSENKGCSAGVNYLAKITHDYKYTFFLERDWILVEQHNPHWLSNAVNYMNASPDVDMVYFRKQVSSLEARQYYGTAPYNTHASINFAGIEYRTTDMHRYTNNPHLRRNESLWKSGVLPLPDIENEVKTNPRWGDAENMHEALPEELNVVFQEYGNFIHFNSRYFDQVSDFGHAPSMHPHFEHTLLRCKNCRFGFLCSEEPDWCDRCEGTERNYEEVERLFVESKS